MKKEDNVIARISLLLVALGTIFGCSGMHAVAKIEDNTVKILSPSFDINVHSDFKVIEKKEGQDSKFMGGEGEVSGTIDHAWFEFINEGTFLDDHTARIRLVVIQYQRLNRANSYYRNVSFDGLEGALGVGKLDINGKAADYAIVAFKHSNGTIFLQKIIAKKIGGQGKCMLQIFYLEEIKDTRNLKTLDSDWHSAAELTAAQKNCIAQFNKNSEAAFEILW